MTMVLLVDDEPSLWDMAKRFLEGSRDMLVDWAFTAQEVLEDLEQKAYDVIVSDYQIPGMDGIEHLREIKAHYNVPFILFSGTIKVTNFRKMEDRP